MQKRILIIDDDEDILEILNIIFQDEGFDVVLSNTGEVAEHLELVHPDLILLDVRITGWQKPGNEICADIRKEYPADTLPVILVSAEDNIDILAAACGANSFIKKPIDLALLTGTVNQFLTLH
jgi:two-component system response regulator VicR